MREHNTPHQIYDTAGAFKESISEQPKPCHLGSVYDPQCKGCEAVNEEKEEQLYSNTTRITVDEKKCTCGGVVGWHLTDCGVFNSLPLEERIEHCSEPKCPECDTAAYERGRKDEREKVVKEIHDLFFF